MKVLKDKIKLDANEQRVGNFVIRDEESHMKVMDINSLFTHRAAKGVPVGMFLKQLYDGIKGGGSDGNGLHNWLAVIFAVFSCIPDQEYLENIFKETEACMKRHPDCYGVKLDGTDEEDAAAVREVKEMMDFEGEVNEMVKNDGQSE